MIDTKKIAEDIVKIMNDCTNDYDAVDFVAAYLDKKLNEEEIIKTPVDVPNLLKVDYRMLQAEFRVILKGAEQKMLTQELITFSEHHMRKLFTRYGMAIKFSITKNMEEGTVTIHPGDPISDLALRWLSEK